MKNFFYLSIFLLFSTQLNAAVFGWLSFSLVSQSTAAQPVDAEQLEQNAVIVEQVTAQTIESFIEKNVATSKFGSRYSLHFDDAKKTIHPSFLTVSRKKQSIATTKPVKPVVGNSSAQTEPVAKLVIVNTLLGIVKENPDMQDSYDNTLLHKSVANNNIELARLLISNGADKLICNKQLETPLKLAEKLGNKEMMELLK